MTGPLGFHGEYVPRRHSAHLYRALSQVRCRFMARTIRMSVDARMCPRSHAKRYRPWILSVPIRRNVSASWHLPKSAERLAVSLDLRPDGAVRALRHHDRILASVAHLPSQACVEFFPSGGQEMQHSDPKCHRPVDSRVDWTFCYSVSGPAGASLATTTFRPHCES